MVLLKNYLKFYLLGRENYNIRKSFIYILGDKSYPSKVVVFGNNVWDAPEKSAPTTKQAAFSITDFSPKKNTINFLHERHPTFVGGL